MPKIAARHFWTNDVPAFFSFKKKTQAEILHHHGLRSGRLGKAKNNFSLTRSFAALPLIIPRALIGCCYDRLFLRLTVSLIDCCGLVDADLMRQLLTLVGCYHPGVNGKYLRVLTSFPPV